MGYSPLILPIGVCFVRHQESRPGDHAAGAGRQGGAGVGAGGDTAGEKHRAASGRGQRLRQELKRRHGSDEVTTRLASLSDQTVSAPTDSGISLRGGADHHEDEDASLAKVLDESALFTERQHGDIDPCVDTDRDVRAMNEGHQQIYRDRATGHPLAHLIDGRA